MKFYKSGPHAARLGKLLRGAFFTAALMWFLGPTAALAQVAVKQALPDSPWGSAPSTSLTRNPSIWVSSMVEAGVTSVRNFDGSTDAHLTSLLDAGVSVVGILWVPADSAALGLAAWKEQVTTTVTKYKGRIRYWEVGNEPPNFLNDKSPKYYGAMVAAAYDAAKEADPTVQIGLAAKSNHVNWLAQSIDAGARDKFDFITLHPYENAELLKQGWEGQFLSIVPTVKAMLREKSPDRATVPVWFTEIGAPVNVQSMNLDSLHEQADQLVKIYSLSLAQGVGRIYWFSPRDSEGEFFGLLNEDNTVRPAYIALKSLSTYLGVQPEYKGWIKQNHGACCGLVFSGISGVSLVLWGKPGLDSLMRLPKKVAVIDPRTGSQTVTNSIKVSSRPLILFAPAGSLVARQWLSLAAVNTAKYFKWYEADSMSSVSLVAGRPPRGIYMVNQPVASTHNGMSEFDMAGNGAARFSVDPSFLSYSTRPIRITAVLRGHSTGDPGFNLKYESDIPLDRTDGNYLTSSVSGWHRVNSTNYYTVSWVIYNPRFVGVYGYNFAFDADGPAHSQFSIQSVTVSKI
jgi:hypothetical protein